MAVIVDQWRLGGGSHSTVGTIADIAPAAGDSQRLVDAGDTVMVIEHNRDVICGTDWIIELGPAGGNKGGQMIFEGTPQRRLRAMNSLYGSLANQYDQALRRKPHECQRPLALRSWSALGWRMMPRASYNTVTTTIAILTEVYMSSPNDWNKQVIEEFRANSGKVGGYFAGRPVLLLHTTGAKTGQERVNPVAYIRDGEDLVVVASKSGGPTNPDWYHNLVANPIVTVEVGTETYPAQATVTAEPERSQLYKQVVATHPGFAEYETKTTRKIPVMRLHRIPKAG